MNRKLVPLIAILLVCDPAFGQNSPGNLFGQTPAEFASRRAAVREAVKDGIVLLCGPGEGSDIERTRFRTDTDLMYLTGVEAPGACLALLPANDPSGKREILFLAPGGNGVWTDPTPGPGKETEKLTGIESVQPLSELWTALKPSIAAAKSIHLAGPVGESYSYFPSGDGAPAGARYFPNGRAEDEIKKAHPNAVIRGNVEEIIHRLRYRKSPGEIANLRAAIAATGQAEHNAGKAIHDGVSELTIEGVVLSGFRAGGGVREGFPCIVGSGPNSTVLHHFSSDRTMKTGEMVVVDIGAEYNYYSADITRTFPVSGKFSPRQKELYQLVLDTQRAAEKGVKPGVTTLGELHRLAVNYLRNSPLRARDSSGNMRTMDAFFVHGLGHPLGMDVHDVGGRGELMQPGVVFTIEPGVYIRSEGIGIRIEDDYLVTETGIEKLSRNIPCEVSEIESLMAGRAEEISSSRQSAGRQSPRSAAGARKLARAGRQRGGFGSTRGIRRLRPRFGTKGRLRIQRRIR